MTIKLEKVGKRFGNQWVFRNINQVFESGKVYAITGANGSGKSTLLKVIAGMLTPNEGSVQHSLNMKMIDVENALLHLTYCAPQLELPEEITVGELLNFHASQRKLEISVSNFINTVKLNANSIIGTLSTGMRQRLKLGLAFFTQSSAVLLDEPTSNFDKDWEQWYRSLIPEMKRDKLFIICSNNPLEFEGFADEMLSL